MNPRALLLAVVTSLLTAAASANATAPPRTTENGTDERWAVTGVEVTLDPSLDELGDGALDEVRAAFGTWLEADPGLPKVTFVVGTSKGDAAQDGINRVLATRHALHGHENDVAYTTTWADGVTGRIIEADLVFNLDHAFAAVPTPAATCEATRRYDVRAVTTHEIGHFFGLAEDLDDPTATMWITTRPCDPYKRALYGGDLTAIASLYPHSTKPLVAKCSAAAGQPAGRGAWTPWALAFMVFLTRRGLWRSRRAPRRGRAR